jgi:hypothetical protein
MLYTHKFYKCKRYKRGTTTQKKCKTYKSTLLAGGILVVVSFAGGRVVPPPVDSPGPPFTVPFVDVEFVVASTNKTKEGNDDLHHKQQQQKKTRTMVVDKGNGKGRIVLLPLDLLLLLFPVINLFDLTLGFLCYMHACICSVLSVQ